MSDTRGTLAQKHVVKKRLKQVVPEAIHTHGRLAHPHIHKHTTEAGSSKVVLHTWQAGTASQL